MPSTIDQEIKACVDSFVSEVSQLVRRAAVEAVADALGQGAGRPAKKASKAPSRPSRASSKAGKRVRRSAKDLEKLAAQVLEQVTKNPGRRLGEIAKSLRADTKDVRRPAFDLVASGKLRTEGERGGTRYFPGGRGGSKAAPKKTRKKGKKKTTARKKAA